LSYVGASACETIR